ncbi:MAG: S-layer homology domain-containing protein [Clostridia bacterium]|nr:S-layer homology domain-containing protein [Clostridia bacterium]
MKKMLCLMMSLMLCLGLVLPVTAAEAESAEMERLILIAKEKLSIDDSLVEFRNYHYNETENGKNYNLYWTSKDEAVYRDISVTIGSDGIITNFYDYENKAEEKPSFAKHTKEEALSVAKDFIEKIDAAKLANIDEGAVSRSYDGAYAVSFNRVHNDIPVANNQLHLTIDGESLKVTGYSAGWQKMTFKEANFITAEEARKAFTDNMGYELFYQVTSKEYENTAHLIYRNRYDENVMIDAETGQPITFDKLYEYATNDKLMMESAADSAGGSSVTLSAIEKELVDKILSMLSKEKADSIARKITEFGIDRSFSIENYSVSRRQTGEYVISLAYRKESKEKDGETAYKHVTLLAETGQVVGYSSSRYVPYDKNQSVKPDLSDETLQKKAKNFLEKYYSEELAQMTEKEFFNHRKGSFEYQRLVDDIRVYNHGASLRFDVKTGELTSFNLQWAETEFPSADVAKTREEANEQAMKLGEFRLRYMPVANEDKTVTACPVYSLQECVILSAETLEALDYALRPKVEKEIPVYTDIAGHYAEEKINKLLSNEIYLAPNDKGALRPAEAISQLDFLLLLDKVIWKRGYETDAEVMYRNLVRQGVLLQEEVAPEAKVSRIDGITWLLRALGYGEFVKIPGIFRCPFRDVPAEQEGVAAVAGGLGLVSGDNGQFYPENELRRADAMIIIYNYMAR